MHLKFGHYIVVLSVLASVNTHSNLWIKLFGFALHNYKFSGCRRSYCKFLQCHVSRHKDSVHIIEFHFM